MPPDGLFSPVVISAGLIGTPEVVYSPIVPEPAAFTTKICARVVPDVAQSATDAAKLERINRIFIGFLSKSKEKVISAVDPAAVSYAGTAWRLAINAILAKSA